MARETQIVLADSGYFIGLFDPCDAHHSVCLAFSERNRGIFVTSWSVFSEVAAMLDRPPLEHFFNWATEAQAHGLLRIENPEPAAIGTLWQWMQRYSDLPMDFCDASLVMLAIEHKIHHIATTDRRDFTVYRLPNRKRFAHVLYESST